MRGYDGRVSIIEELFDKSNKELMHGNYWEAKLYLEKSKVYCEGLDYKFWLGIYY